MGMSDKQFESYKRLLLLNLEDASEAIKAASIYPSLRGAKRRSNPEMYDLARDLDCFASLAMTI